MLAATDPDAPAERMEISARRCQFPPAAPLATVQIVVEPSFRVKVRLGKFEPGSTLEPKASTLIALRVASAPAGMVVVPSSKVSVPFVDQTVTCAALTCNGAGA